MLKKLLLWFLSAEVWLKQHVKEDSDKDIGMLQQRKRLQYSQ